jgi:hypothetical protein
MKSTIIYAAPLLAAAAISGAIGLAPLAFANTGSGPVPHSASATSTAPAPAPYGTGVNPLTPGDVGASPYVPVYPGYSPAF